jgi:hypothetical protein
MGGQYQNGSEGIVLKDVEWIDLAYDRDKWVVFMKAVMNLWINAKHSEFLNVNFVVRRETVRL